MGGEKTIGIYVKVVSVRRVSGVGKNDSCEMDRMNECSL